MIVEHLVCPQTESTEWNSWLHMDKCNELHWKKKVLVQVLLSTQCDQHKKLLSNSYSSIFCCVSEETPLTRPSERVEALVSLYTRFNRSFYFLSGLICKKVFIIHKSVAKLGLAHHDHAYQKKNPRLREANWLPFFECLPDLMRQ